MSYRIVFAACIAGFALSTTHSAEAQQPQRRRISSSKLKARPKLKRRVRAEQFEIDPSIRTRFLDIPAAKFQKMRLARTGPQIELAVQPTAPGGEIYYHRMAPHTANKKESAQLSVRFAIRNKSSQKLVLQKVQYTSRGYNKTYSANLEIDPGKKKDFQNSRDYHQTGDVLYLKAPFPKKVTAKLYFRGFRAPVVVTRELRPFKRAMQVPFKASDLRKGEVWESASTHGGGSQVFAYDMGVHGFDGKNWSSNLPKRDGSRNGDKRVWAKPIYATDAGVVTFARSDIPDNPKPGVNDEKLWKIKDSYWPHTGNVVIIKHNDGMVTVYAHFKKHTVKVKKGDKVKRGQLLGRVGNSGNSTGPHLHIQMWHDNKGFRPLQFTGGYAIMRDALPRPDATTAWSKLTNHGIPGVPTANGNNTKRAYIWPSTKHPRCGKKPSRPGGWWSYHAIPENRYQKVFDETYTCGYMPVAVDAFNAGGRVYFNAIFSHANTGWIARHNLSGSAYQREFNKHTKAGYRLVHVDSYLRGSKVNYAAIWAKKSGPAWVAYHGRSGAAHQKEFTKLVKKGYVPVTVSGVSSRGRQYFTALYEKRNTKGLYAHHGMTEAAYQKFFNKYAKKGFKLVSVNGYTHKGQPRINAIWYGKPPFKGYVARHGMDVRGYQREFDKHTKAKMKVRAVTGYARGRKPYFAGLWVR